MRLLALFFCILFFGVFSPVAAQDDSSEFTIRVFAGTDDEAPTTPTLLSATAISPTQVDLSWTPATDNFFLSGYVVYSGSTTIATTTLTTYSDVGLAASTTYTYSVRAFDLNGNYSSSSNSIVVTTPDFPAEPVQPEPGEGTVARVVVDEVQIIPDIRQATFNIQSKFPARFEIKWGRTAIYEQGYVASDILRRDYTTVLTDLEPGTYYEYEIIGYTPFGVSNVVERGKFRTLDDVDLTAPANVKRFRGLQNGGDVNLSWELPDDDDIAYVRIVRSHLGYPVSLNDGAIVYQGLGNRAVDESVLYRYSPAYYTAFVVDTSGNISSGALSIVYADWSGGNGQGLDEGEGERGSIIGLEPLSSTTQMMPDAFEILIKQADKEYSFGDSLVTLAHDQLFVLYLPADKVTANLKSIIVNLQDPTDQRQSFSFLLRLNKDQTAYEAIVAPLQVVGESSIVLSIYDFRALRVAEYRSRISFEEFDSLPTEADLQSHDVRLLWQFLLTALLVLMAFVWWLIAKKRGEDEDKETDENEENKV